MIACSWKVAKRLDTRTSRFKVLICAGGVVKKKFVRVQGTRNRTRQNFLHLRKFGCRVVLESLK